MNKKRVYLGHVTISSDLYKKIQFLMDLEGETKVSKIIALCVKREVDRRKK